MAATHPASQPTQPTAPLDNAPGSKLTTLRLAHLPPTHAAHVALFRSVRNASALRAQLLAGNSDFEYAFIDARMILSPLHLLGAVFRAVTDATARRLRTRNVHSEIVFSLGGSNNISSTLRAFGLSESTTSLLAVKISAPDASNDVAAFLAANVDGEMAGFTADALAASADEAAIRAVYKLGVPGQPRAASGGKGRKRPAESEETSAAAEWDAEESRRELEVWILGVLALRGS